MKLYIGWIAVAIAVHAAASEVKKDANPGHDSTKNLIERNNEEVGNKVVVKRQSEHYKKKKDMRKEGSPFNAQKEGKSKIQRVAQNRADGKTKESNKEVFEAHVSKVLKQRKPVARIAQDAGVNFNNVITNVCHPENSQGGFRSRLVPVKGPRPAANGGVGSSSSSSGICESASVFNGILGIGASFAGASANPAVGVAAGVGAAAFGMILAMSCPSSTEDGMTQLREEMIQMMADSITTHIRDEIANEMEHIAEMLEHDEIFPYSIVAAEAYSRDLSLLQDKAYEAFTWDGLLIYATISKAHILMKEYLVPHSFKISIGCGLERLESLERAKGIAFEEFQTIADDYSILRSDWWGIYYNRPTHRQKMCFSYTSSEFCGTRYEEYWHVSYYSWRDMDGDYHTYEYNDAQFSLAIEEAYAHYEAYFHDNVGNYDSIWTQNVVNFRNRLLSDNLEDQQACGQIGNEELACNSATGRTECDQNLKICVLPGPFISYVPLVVRPPHTIVGHFNPFGHYHNGKALGVISQPGQNFQISFRIQPHRTDSGELAGPQTIVRGTNRENYASYGFYNRHPLIYWRHGKIVVAANDLEDSNWLGFSSPPITMSQYTSITVTFLKDKIVYCNEHDCYSTVAPIDQRPAFDNMYLRLGDKYHKALNLSLDVKDFQFTKIMDGYKIFQGVHYEVTDYKISGASFQSPMYVAQPAFALIPNPTRKFQISFIIERRNINRMSGIRCVLRFEGESNFYHTDIYFYFNIGYAGWMLVVDYYDEHIATLELPLGEKIHVKFVDLGGNSFWTYVNGKKFEKRYTSSRPALSSQLKVHKTHNVRNEFGDSGIHISDLHYTYLNPV